jgi:hypothetical protein
MDQRAHDIEQDLKHILDLRLALSDKMELLERRVEETVQMTKAAVLEALDLARDKAGEIIESAAMNLDPSRQAQRRPWLLVGSAVAAGILAGLIEQQRRRGVYPHYPPAADGADVMPSEGDEPAEPHRGVYTFYGRESPDRRKESKAMHPSSRLANAWRPFLSFWNELSGELMQERERLQYAALHAGRAFIHDVARIAGRSLLDQLTRPDPASSRAQPRQSRP